jgi:uncharacterized membrane protein
MARPRRLANPGKHAYLPGQMDDHFFMDAVITPHRSLSSRGFIVLIAVLTTINVASAAFFLAMGAGPVPLFLGLDLLAVVIAFQVSHRAGRRAERVQVTAAEIRVVVQSGDNARTVWISPTAFTRIAVIRARDGAGDLRLRLSDREIAIARALSHPERLDFAKALDLAVWRARSGSFQTPTRANALQPDSERRSFPPVS